jgi:hypothetical protein
MESTIIGILVSVETSPYRTFVGGDGTTVPAGIAYYAWVVQSSTSAPSRVQMPNKEAAEALVPGIGKSITLKARAFAANNTIRYKVMAAA